MLMIARLPITVSAFFGENETLSVAVCPGAIVDPFTPPPVWMSAAETPILDTVKLEFPVFFKVTARVSVFPTVSFPNTRVAGVTVKTGVAATPLPLMVSVTVLFDAVLVIEALPATEPVVVGVKTNVQATVAPGANTRGVVKPRSANIGLLTVDEETVMLVFPLFFSCTAWELLVPTGTFPKLALLGVTVRSPPVVCTPVPVIP